MWPWCPLTTFTATSNGKSRLPWWKSSSYGTPGHGIWVFLTKKLWENKPYSRNLVLITEIFYCIKAHSVRVHPKIPHIAEKTIYPETHISGTQCTLYHYVTKECFFILFFRQRRVFQKHPVSPFHLINSTQTRHKCGCVGVQRKETLSLRGPRAQEVTLTLFQTHAKEVNLFFFSNYQQAKWRLRCCVIGTSEA